LTRDELYQRFRENNIYVRRYFYPLISEFPMYRALPSANKSNLPVASMIADKVLCLPIYPDMSFSQIQIITSLI